MAIHDQNHTMSAGESKVFTATVRTRAANALVSFTSATITWRLKSSTATVLTKTTVSGISITSTGVFTITLDPADTVGFSGEYRHECRAVLSDTSVVVMFDGILFIEPSITA